MRVVMGELNGVFLREIHDTATANITFVQAAVAYAHRDEFFERCRERNVRLQYFGLLDDSGAVSLPLLERFLNDRSGRMECRLINGHFHPKVIWWRGNGAYLGSANLTYAAWYKNIECGVFFTEEELATQGVADELEDLFRQLLVCSLPLSQETYDKLKRLSIDREYVKNAQDEVSRRFDEQFGSQLPFKGLTSVPAKGEKVSAARIGFVKEWHETLQLLRSLSQTFEALGKRPSWVPSNANRTVHFDQYLHAYYYSYIRDGDDEGKSVEQVERAFEQHKNDPMKALREGADWWAKLDTAPNNEDTFIASEVPFIHQTLAKESLSAITIEKFSLAMRHVNAFRTHARQVKNDTLGLPLGHTEDMESRTKRVAEWLWGQRTETGHTVQEVLNFVLYGHTPPEMEERLWLATRTSEWRLPHFGKSILGEAIGWALPDRYPPRNNRTNKALRALGYDVKLFSAE